MLNVHGLQAEDAAVADSRRTFHALKIYKNKNYDHTLKSLKIGHMFQNLHLKNEFFNLKQI